MIHESGLFCVRQDAGHQVNVSVVDLVSCVDNAYIRGTLGVCREESTELSMVRWDVQGPKGPIVQGQKEGGLGFWDIPAKVAALKTT